MEHLWVTASEKYIFMIGINNFSNVELQLTQAIMICHQVGTDH